MNGAVRSALIDDWYNYSYAVVRKGRRLLHDILTAWPLPDQTLVDLVTEALKDYCSLWEILLKLLDGDKPFTSLHHYIDAYPRNSRSVNMSLRNALSTMCEAGLIDLGEEYSNEILELTMLHASDGVSVVHHGNRTHPVFPAIAALLHDVLEECGHRISTLAVFPQTRRGARSLKAYLKLLSSCWFIDVVRASGLESMEIALPSSIAHSQRTSLEPLFRLVTVDSVTYLYYYVDCARGQGRTLRVVFGYYSLAAQLCLNVSQCPTRLQLFDPIFSPSSALSSNPTEFTSNILLLLYACHDVSADINTEPARISIYTASCSLSISAVAQLFRPDHESTYHYYFWKHNAAVPLSGISSQSAQVALLCVPPLSDQAMTVYFKNLITATNGCIYISCLTGSYIQSLQHTLLSVLSADEFYHIRPDRLHALLSTKDNLCKYKIIIFSSSSDILLYMRKYRMLLPAAESLLLFNGATSEPLLHALVDSLGSALRHVTIFYNDSSIYSTIKDIFQRFYDGLDVVFSRKTVHPKRVGHNTRLVAEHVVGAGMLSQEARKKVALFYGDVELFDTLALAAAVTRFGPGDGLCLTDLGREMAYQASIQKAYTWKPVKISPEEWLLVALCITETYFSGTITTTALCTNVIEIYCGHLQDLSVSQRQLVVRLLCLTMGTQPEYRHLVDKEAEEPYVSVETIPIIKRCYENFKVSTLTHMRRIVRAIIVKLLICRALYPHCTYKLDTGEAQTLLQRHFEESIPLSIEMGSLALLLAGSNMPLHSKLSELGEWNTPLLSSCLQHFCIAGVSKKTERIVRFE